MTIPGPTDLDQSGSYFQTLRVYMGPSLGWVDRKPGKAQLISAVGTYDVDPGVQIVYVETTAAVTLNLPSVEDWLKQQVQMAANGWEASIWVKDLSTDRTNAIIVHPFTGDEIDTLAQDYEIIQIRTLLRLYPLNDLSGWMAG